MIVSGRFVGSSCGLNRVDVGITLLAGLVGYVCVLGCVLEVVRGRVDVGVISLGGLMGLA